MNLIQVLAKEEPFFFWCHADARFPPEVCKEIIKEAESLEAINKRWGVIFTNYDILCCYSTRCCKEVGPYDCFFNCYTSDCDWYRRVRLAGFETISRGDLGKKVQHMEGGSSTIKAMPKFNAWVQRNMKHWNAYYVDKWGGLPRHERFSSPFNETKTKPKTLQESFSFVCAAQSGINEHLATLANLARECEHVSEFGRGHGHSTVAFLTAKPKKFISYDCKPVAVDDSWLASIAESDFEFVEIDTRYSEIVETDLLFIDSEHTYEHIRLELARNGNKAKKYLVFHDSVTYGTIGIDKKMGIMPAIEEFMLDNPWWVVHKHYRNNNGLLILKRN